MWILWAGVLLCSSSYTMAVPFLPLFLFDLGVGEGSVNLWAGIVHASAFMVGAVMAPLWGSVADKYGRRKMVIRAGVCLAVIYALLAFVRNPWELIIVRMLHGLVGGFVPASMAIVASVAPEKEMGWSLGMMQAGTMTGGILGPLFGGLLANVFGLRLSFIVAACVIFIATMAVLIWVQEGRQALPAKRRGGMLQELAMIFRSRVLLSLLLLLLVFQISSNMIQPLITLHVANLQGDLQGAVLTSGFVLALIGIAGIIASPVWGRLGEKQGYMQILRFCLLIGGAVISLQFWVHSLWLFGIVQFVFGLFVAGIAPAVNTLVVRSTEDEFRGRSFGLTASANQLGGMIGPLIGGLLGLFLGIHWIFVASGMLLVLAGIVVSKRAITAR